MGASVTAGPPAGIRTVPAATGLASTRLVLVRHGEAVCNVSGVCGGPRGCTGLTASGVSQVHALRHRLESTRELAGVDALYSSILPRAVQTADLLAPALVAIDVDGTTGPLPQARVDCGLCELHPGAADALPWGEFGARFGEPDWDADPSRAIAPGGESWTGFVARVAETLRILVARHPGQLVVAACHAGVIEASFLAMMPVVGNADGARLQLRTQHASLTTWEVDRGRWRLLGYNDAAHLVSPAIVPVTVAAQQAAVQQA